MMLHFRDEKGSYMFASLPRKLAQLVIYMLMYLSSTLVPLKNV